MILESTEKGRIQGGEEKREWGRKRGRREWREREEEEREWGRN